MPSPNSSHGVEKIDLPKHTNKTDWGPANSWGVTPSNTIDGVTWISDEFPIPYVDRGKVTTELLLMRVERHRASADELHDGVRAAKLRLRMDVRLATDIHLGAFRVEGTDRRLVRNLLCDEDQVRGFGPRERPTFPNAP